MNKTEEPAIKTAKQLSQKKKTTTEKEKFSTEVNKWETWKLWKERKHCKQNLDERHKDTLTKSNLSRRKVLTRRTHTLILAKCVTNA